MDTDPSGYTPRITTVPTQKTAGNSEKRGWNVPTRAAKSSIFSLRRPNSPGRAGAWLRASLPHGLGSVFEAKRHTEGR